ncbi:MAG: hypothetical protein LBF28_00450 [Rickettsiales bacterium]|jgi:hypothetical protein|nr:hypothetical protein [Rickettsiales bacterium]
MGYKIYEKEEVFNQQLGEAIRHHRLRGGIGLKQMGNISVLLSSKRRNTKPYAIHCLHTNFLK